MEHFSPVKVKPVSSFSSPVIDDNSLLDRNLAADDFYASSQSWGSQKWIVDNKKNEMKSLIEKAEHLKL